MRDQSAPVGAGRAQENEAPNPAFAGCLEKVEGADDVRLDERPAVMGLYVRFVQGCGVNDSVGSFDTPRTNSGSSMVPTRSVQVDSTRSTPVSSWPSDDNTVTSAWPRCPELPVTGILIPVILPAA